MAIQLSNLQKGRLIKPPRVVIFGEEKIGKSTFGSHAPNPIFMNIEDGSDFLDTTRVFNKEYKPTLEHCFETLDALRSQEHNFQTIVIDSIDWLESEIEKDIMRKNNTKTIQEIGYGRGGDMVLDEMRQFLIGCNILREERDMAIVLIAHAKIKEISEDPLDDNHQRHILKLRPKVEGVIKEWADFILFARQKFYVKKIDAGFGKKTGKVLDSQDRILCSAKSPAYTGGVRIQLPEEMPLSWDAFYQSYVSAMTAPTTTKN